MVDALASPQSMWQTTIGSGSGTTSQNQVGTNNATGTQQSTFTPLQQQLQQQYAGQLNGLMTGQSIPQNFQVPQSAIDQYASMYNKYVAPQRAAQYGAGSPTIATGMQEGLANLIGQNSMQGMSQYMNMINGAAQVAFNPTGSNTSGTSGGTVNNTGTSSYNGSSNNFDTGGIIGSVTGGVTSALRSLFP